MKKIAHLAATAVTGLSLAGGFAGVAGASSASIDTTGPESNNQVEFSNSQVMDLNNLNNVALSSSAWQNADSGNAKVKHNTTGGSASTGDASNTSTSSFVLTITN